MNRIFNYDFEFFVNWLAENHYMTTIFGLFYKKFGTKGAFQLMVKRSKGTNPKDYIENILEYPVGCDKLIDKINEEWKAYISQFVDYKPKEDDVVFAGFIDCDGLHAWISILHDVKHNGTIVEKASAYYIAPTEYEDELGFITYTLETNKYEFMRKATDEEKEWLMKLLEEDKI